MDIEKAKERLKGVDIKVFLSGMAEQSNYIVDKADETNEAIETVLNELEKKEKEIARLGKTANEYKKAIQCEKCNCSVCEAHINTLELRAELEKKDKIINEMSNFINSMSNELVAETGDNNLEFCKMQKCIDNGEIDCEECIKEYFTNKAENVGE